MTNKNQQPELPESSIGSKQKERKSFNSRRQSSRQVEREFISDNWSIVVRWFAYLLAVTQVMVVGQRHLILHLILQIDHNVMKQAANQNNPGQPVLVGPPHHSLDHLPHLLQPCQCSLCHHPSCEMPPIEFSFGFWELFPLIRSNKPRQQRIPWIPNYVFTYLWTFC